MLVIVVGGFLINRARDTSTERVRGARRQRRASASPSATRARRTPWWSTRTSSAPTAVSWRRPPTPSSPRWPTRARCTSSTARSTCCRPTTRCAAASAFKVVLDASGPARREEVPRPALRRTSRRGVRPLPRQQLAGGQGRAGGGHGERRSGRTSSRRRSKAWVDAATQGGQRRRRARHPDDPAQRQGLPGRHAPSTTSRRTCSPPSSDRVRARRRAGPPRLAPCRSNGCSAG